MDMVGKNSVHQNDGQGWKKNAHLIVRNVWREGAPVLPAMIKFRRAVCSGPRSKSIQYYPSRKEVGYSFTYFPSQF